MFFPGILSTSYHPIREFQDKVAWYEISYHQKLSEGFIREFQDKVDWSYISKYQKLSEDFIQEFKDSVDWHDVSRYQKLSENFIRKYFIREERAVYWSSISRYQKLSAKFRKEHNVYKQPDSWLYKSTKSKLAYIKAETDYELVDDDNAIIAYKAVHKDGHSVYNFQYHYVIGGIYEAHCDMNIDNQNSFGLSSWTLEKAKDYYSRGKIFKVKILIKDIGAIVHSNQKIRSTRIEILDLETMGSV